MQTRITILLILTIQIGMASCRQNDTWYEDTKKVILEQSNLESDSIAYSYNEDSTFKKEHRFLSGHEFLMKGFNKGILRLEIHFNRTKEFELRRELCDNGNYGFEGIFYKDNPYGLSTWRFCNGKIQEQGIRFNDKQIGKWKKWDENGMIIEQSDNGNIEQIDSMPKIEK